MAKKWIKGAIKRPGAFSAKAKRAGMSTEAYAQKVLRRGSRASTRTKRQAALAETLMVMKKKSKRKKRKGQSKSRASALKELY